MVYCTTINHKREKLLGKKRVSYSMQLFSILFILDEIRETKVSHSEVYKMKEKYLTFLH